MILSTAVEHSEKPKESGEEEPAALLVLDLRKLIEEIEERAAVSGGTLDPNYPVSLSYRYEEDPRSSFGIACVDIYPRHESGEIRVCRKGETIGTWKLSAESVPRHLIFTRKVPKEVIRRAFSLSWKL